MLQTFHNMSLSFGFQVNISLQRVPAKARQDMQRLLARLHSHEFPAHAEDNSQADKNSSWISNHDPLTHVISKSIKRKYHAFHHPDFRVVYRRDQHGLRNMLDIPSKFTKTTASIILVFQSPSNTFCIFFYAAISFISQPIQFTKPSSFPEGLLDFGSTLISYKPRPSTLN